MRIVDLARRFIEAHGLSAQLPGAAPSTLAGQMRIVFTGSRPGEKLHEQLAQEADGLAQTTHPDILVVRLPEPDEAQINQMLTGLSPEQRGGDRVGVAALVRRLRPLGFDAYLSGTRAKSPNQYRVRVRPGRGDEVGVLKAALEKRGYLVWVTRE